ncbi:MAG: hypothetical protein ACRDN0_09205 [Trebonia sp.]
MLNWRRRAEARHSGPWARPRRAASGDLLGGGADETEDGDPGGEKRAVEVAGVLASPDELFELSGGGVVGGVALGRRDQGEGGQEGAAALEPNSGPMSYSARSAWAR